MICHYLRTHDRHRTSHRNAHRSAHDNIIALYMYVWLAMCASCALVCVTNDGIDVDTHDRRGVASREVEVRTGTHALAQHTNNNKHTSARVNVAHHMEGGERRVGVCGCVCV